jgi:hypothetical protein
MRREPIEVRKATLASPTQRPTGRSRERTPGASGWARRVPARVPDGPGGDRVQAAGIALQIRPIAGLVQVQEPGSAGSQTGGRRGMGKVREDSDSSCADSGPFDALDRFNTGSAKNTPKSDMAMLAPIQHLASLNWASHLIVDRRLKRPLGC